MSFAVVDVETTGDGPTDRVIEIAVILFDGRTTQEWSSYVRPDPLTRNAAHHINGIGAKAIAEAPTFAEIADEVTLRLSNRIIVAHKVEFDQRMLLREFHLAGVQIPPINDWRCTLTAAQREGQRFPNLSSCCKRWSISRPVAHRALSDARACLGLFRIIGADRPGTALIRANPSARVRRIPYPRSARGRRI